MWKSLFELQFNYLMKRSLISERVYNYSLLVLRRKTNVALDEDVQLCLYLSQSFVSLANNYCEPTVLGLNCLIYSLETVLIFVRFDCSLN